MWWVKWLKNRAKFYLSCNYYCTLYFFVKMKEVKLKNLYTSAYLESKLWHNKTETKDTKEGNGRIYQNL